jgi:hypothetical protein
LDRVRIKFLLEFIGMCVPRSRAFGRLARLIRGYGACIGLLAKSQQAKSTKNQEQQAYYVSTFSISAASPEHASRCSGDLSPSGG